MNSKKARQLRQTIREEAKDVYPILPKEHLKRLVTIMKKKLKAQEEENAR